MTVSVKAPTSNTGSIQLNGSDVLTIESDRSVDIDSGTLHVDATNNKVGIGTTSPSTSSSVYLHVNSSGNNLIRIQGGVGSAKGIEMYDGTNQPSQIYNASSDLRFFANSAERMRIDSNGVVTKPYQPAFMVKSTVGTVTYSGGAVIPFGSFLTQTGSEYSTSTSRFTASVAGNYFFSTLIYFQGTGSLAFNKNGSEVGGVSPLLIAQEGGWSGTMSIVIYLAANDYVDVRSRSSTSSTIFGGHSTFQGFLIG